MDVRALANHTRIWNAKLSTQALPASSEMLLFACTCKYHPNLEREVVPPGSAVPLDAPGDLS
jgi:hypothetical protein